MCALAVSLSSHPWSCSVLGPPAVISLITCLGLGCLGWLGAGFGHQKPAGQAAWYHGQSWGDLGEDWDWSPLFYPCVCSLAMKA